MMKQFRFGAENETVQWLKETSNWISSAEWIDVGDNFNYSQALLSLDNPIQLPPTLFIMAKKDPILGNIDDCTYFAFECHRGDMELAVGEPGEEPTYPISGIKLQVLDKTKDGSHAYDHNSMLLHPEASNEHFNDILLWINQCQR